MLRKVLAAGETAFREGGPPVAAYLIERGEVRLSAGAVELARLGPGDLLGEMAVLDDAPHTVTATALSDCVLLALDRAQIAERLAATDPIVRALLESQLKRHRGALAALQGKGILAPAAETDSAIEPQGIGRLRLESQLREALGTGGLDVRYQPILEIASGGIAGYEALVRWTHPEHGPISPAHFIALAEETSLIVPVGEYVFDAACAMLARLRDRHAVSSLPTVAVNVSARQLAHAGLIERVVARREAWGLPQGCLRVEITESRRLDYPQVAQVIANCHAHGIPVALDDFGMGWSHLAHLHRLQFDTVKVDRVFAHEMLASERAMAIVRAIVQMAQAIGADVIVEGIETAAQLAVLRELGCRYAQGWLIGRPQTPDELLAASA